jgi:uncharacterized protein YjaG (DUF416 family)
MSGEINSAAPSLQKAINQRRSQKSDDQLEMKGREISQEAAGDSQTKTTTVDSTNRNTTLKDATSRDIEKAEKFLDVSRTGQSTVENSESKKKEKEVEENSKAMDEAINQQIINTWNDVGGAK